jgi:hypothetical protein
MEVSSNRSIDRSFANGIVTLSPDEIELVSGGKSAVSLSGLIGKIISWIQNIGSQPTQPPTPPTIDWATVAAMQDACIDAGGTASVTINYETGSGSVLVARGDGSSFELTINCVQ